MQKEKKIKISNNNFILISYNENFFNNTDTTVATYDKHKISILLTEGLHAVVRNTIINSGKNSVLFFRPDEPHFGRFTKSGIHSYIDFFIPPEFFEAPFMPEGAALFLDDTSDDRINYIFGDGNTKQKISEITKETLSILNQNDPLCDIKLFSIIIQLILICANTYEKQKENPIKDNFPAIVTNILDYIAENYEKKITLDMLAKASNCSVAYLSRIFKAHTGTTIYNHIIVTRIAHAQILLKNGATVTEACFSSGFEDCSNFIQTFKKVTNKTPYAYKMEYKE